MAERAITLKADDGTTFRVKWLRKDDPTLEDLQSIRDQYKALPSNQRLDLMMSAAKQDSQKRNLAKDYGGPAPKPESGMRPIGPQDKIAPSVKKKKGESDSSYWQRVADLRASQDAEGKNFWQQIGSIIHSPEGATRQSVNALGTKTRSVLGPLQPILDTGVAGVANDVAGFLADLGLVQPLSAMADVRDMANPTLDRTLAQKAGAIANVGLSFSPGIADVAVAMPLGVAGKAIAKTKAGKAVVGKVMEKADALRKTKADKATESFLAQHPEAFTPQAPQFDVPTPKPQPTVPDLSLPSTGNVAPHTGTSVAEDIADAGPSSAHHRAKAEAYAQKANENAGRYFQEGSYIQAETEQIRADLNLPEYDKRSKTLEDIVQNAYLNKDVDNAPYLAKRVIAAFDKGKDLPISDEQTAGMKIALGHLLDKSRNLNEVIQNTTDDATLAALSHEYDKAEETAGFIMDALDKAGSAWGRSGRVRSEMLAMDYSEGGLMRKAMRVKREYGLDIGITPEERQKIREAAKRVADANAASDAVDKIAGERMVAEILNGGDVKVRWGGTNVRVTRDKYEEAKRILLSGQASAGVDPAKIKALYDIVAFHMEAGAKSLADLAKRIRATGAQVDDADIVDAYNQYNATQTKARSSQASNRAAANTRVMQTAMKKMEALGQLPKMDWNLLADSELNHFSKDVGTFVSKVNGHLMWSARGMTDSAVSAYKKEAKAILKQFADGKINSAEAWEKFKTTGAYKAAEDARPNSPDWQGLQDVLRQEASQQSTVAAANTRVAQKTKNIADTIGKPGGMNWDQLADPEIRNAQAQMRIFRSQANAVVHAVRQNVGEEAAASVVDAAKNAAKDLGHKATMNEAMDRVAEAARKAGGDADWLDKLVPNVEKAAADLKGATSAIGRHERAVVYARALLRDGMDPNDVLNKITDELGSRVDAANAVKETLDTVTPIGKTVQEGYKYKPKATPKEVSEARKALNEARKVADETVRGNRQTVFGWIDKKLSQNALTNITARVLDLSGNTAHKIKNSAQRPLDKAFDSLFDMAFYHSGETAIADKGQLQRAGVRARASLIDELGQSWKGNRWGEEKMGGDMGLVGHMAAATDAPFKNAYFWESATVHADREAAKQLGKNATKEELLKRSDWILDNLDKFEDIRKVAEDEALARTWNAPNFITSTVGGGMAHLRPGFIKAGMTPEAANVAADAVKLGGNILGSRFGRVVTNVLWEKAMSNPAGVANGAFKLRQALLMAAKEKGSVSIAKRREIAQMFSRGTVGTGLVALGYNYPNIAEALKEATGGTVQLPQLGGVHGKNVGSAYMDFGDAGQITALSPLFLGYQLRKAKDMGSASMLHSAIIDNFLSTTYTSGIQRAARLMDEKQFGKAVASLAASNLIPGFVRDAAKRVDAKDQKKSLDVLGYPVLTGKESQRQTKTPGDEFKKYIPLEREKLPLKVDTPYKR